MSYELPRICNPGLYVFLFVTKVSGANKRREQALPGARIPDCSLKKDPDCKSGSAAQ